MFLYLNPLITRVLILHFYSESVRELLTCFCYYNGTREKSRLYID